MQEPFLPKTRIITAFTLQSRNIHLGTGISPTLPETLGIAHLSVRNIHRFEHKSTVLSRMLGSLSYWFYRGFSTFCQFLAVLDFPQHSHLSVRNVGLPGSFTGVSDINRGETNGHFCSKRATFNNFMTLRGVPRALRSEGILPKNGGRTGTTLRNILTFLSEERAPLCASLPLILPKNGTTLRIVFLLSFLKNGHHSAPRCSLFLWENGHHSAQSSLFTTGRMGTTLRRVLPKTEV